MRRRWYGVLESNKKVFEDVRKCLQNGNLVSISHNFPFRTPDPKEPAGGIQTRDARRKPAAQKTRS